MFTFIFSVAIYMAIGYFVFRAWMKLIPPQNGTFSNFWFEDNYPTPSTGWFTPSWINRSKVRSMSQSYRDLKWTRGQSVSASFWQCVTLWPFIVLIAIVVNAGRKLYSVGNSVSLAVTKHVVPHVTNESTE